MIGGCTHMHSQVINLTHTSPTIQIEAVVEVVRKVNTCTLSNNDSDV